MEVSSAVASELWARLTWSKALFGLLVINVAWTASLFICPYLAPSGSFANQVGGANVIDHENIWATYSIYPRIIYTIGDAQCHQLFYRSFWLNGNQMPIDERMTSMYVFANLGVLAAIFAQPSTSTGQVMLNALPRFLSRRPNAEGRPAGLAEQVISDPIAVLRLAGNRRSSTSRRNAESTRWSPT